MAVFLSIGTQVINQLSTTVGIFTGENVQQGWSSITKSNNAVFIVGQLNLVINNINIVNDPDLIDNPNISPNIDASIAPAIFEGI
jgi:hypothetical protein